MDFGNSSSSSYADGTLPPDVNDRVMMTLLKSLGRETLTRHLVPERPTIRDPLLYINPLIVNQIGQLPPLLGGMVQHKEDNYKTAMCETWLMTGVCDYGASCRFAHGEHEKRHIKPMPRNPRKYKTALCMKYTTNGICPYGEDCFYVHPDPNDLLNQKFFELNRTFEKSLRHPVALSSDDRTLFSASVPAGITFADGPWHVHHDEYVPDNNAMSGIALESQNLANHRETRVTSSSTAEPASSNSDLSISPSLKQQVIEQLRKQNDTTFLPPEERITSNDEILGPFKSEYRIFETPDFSKSFSGVRSFIH